MKIQLDWLKEYVDIDVSAEEVGHLLTMAGLEIEALNLTKLEQDRAFLFVNAKHGHRCDTDNYG